MNPLFLGLKKFSETAFQEDEALFKSLIKGQTPHTLFITCSDSRIVPNLLTQTKPGELFTIRNAGNIVPPFGSGSGGEAATIEYAIEGLGVHNIVVCGHSNCGAMMALLGRVDVSGLPSMASWLHYAQATRSRMRDFVSGDNEADNLRAIQENVLVQVDNLKTHPAVSAASRKRKINIFGWVYHLEDGHVTVYDKEEGKFVPSEKAEGDKAPPPRFFL